MAENQTAEPKAPAAGVHKPLGMVDEDQAAYAEERNRIVTAQQKAAAKASDPWAEGEKVAELRADMAEAAREVQKEDGGGLATNDIMAGPIAETINQPPVPPARDQTRLARLMVRAAKAMGKHANIGAMLPSADTWGLVGMGDEVVGHYVLIDLDTLEKVIVTERWVINEDRVFANAQQWPKALMVGDTLKRVAKG